MGRSAAVILFIAAVAAVAVYCAQRRTIARGDVLATELMGASPLLEKLDCDKEVPIGVAGATFGCRAFFKNGESTDVVFKLDRAGHISSEAAGSRIKKTSDPWGD